MRLKTILSGLNTLILLSRHAVAAGMGAIGGIFLGWFGVMAFLILRSALHLPTPPPSEIDIGRSPIFWGSMVFSSVCAVFKFRKEQLGIPLLTDCRRFAAWMRRDKPRQQELPFDR